MSFIKINKVNRLDNAINYILSPDKTKEHLVSTYACDRDSAFNEFNEVYNQRLLYTGKETKNKARMIIQSFDPDDNVQPEHAHEIANEFAKRYLKGKHQYIIATHIDGNQTHNHIIFNEVNLENYKMFDTKRSNTNTKLHQINNELDMENNLNVIEKPKVKKTSYSQREYVARSKGQSYKQKLENIIDQAIKNSTTYDEFMNTMKTKDIEIKEGKYLSFKPAESERFIRGKTLGINYNEESIKFRIDNPEFTFEKIEPILKTEWIDKREDKYKNNIGLSRWASKQNINHLQELSKLVFEKNLTLDEIQEIKTIQDNIRSSIEIRINEYDEQIYRAEQNMNCFADYKNSWQLMKDYKQAGNKSDFKRDNYEGFKKYDTAKKGIHYLKKHLGINDENELSNHIQSLKEERSKMYQEYHKAIKKEKEANKSL